MQPRGSRSAVVRLQLLLPLQRQAWGLSLPRIEHFRLELMAMLAWSRPPLAVGEVGRAGLVGGAWVDLAAGPAKAERASGGLVRLQQLGWVSGASGMAGDNASLRSRRGGLRVDQRRAKEVGNKAGNRHRPAHL